MSKTPDKRHIDGPSSNPGEFTDQRGQNLCFFKDAPVYPINTCKPAVESSKKMLTFLQLVERCRSLRQRAAKLSASGSFSNFVFAHKPMADCIRLYSVGRCSKSFDNSILCVDIDENFANNYNKTSETPILIWRPLMENEKHLNDSTIIMSKEEELLRQRLRLFVGGVSAYNYHQSTSKFLFSSNSCLYTLVDADYLEHASIPEKLIIVNSGGHAPMDSKFCPTNSDLISYILHDDLFVQFNNSSSRITNTGDDKYKTKTAGVASFIVQEEFDRFTGYWWCPISDGKKYYILYEENDLSDVELISINCAAETSNNVELMRYPKPGKPNARWSVKIAEIELETKQVKSKTLRCVYDLHKLFPWAEYLLRAGWMPKGNGVWLQFLSRLQRKTCIVFLPLSLFHDETEPLLSTDLIDFPDVVVLYEEETPDLLIKDHNYFYILEQSDNSNTPDCIKFLWCHSKTGFRHLYLVNSHLSNATRSDRLSTIKNHDDPFLFYHVTELPLTEGQWEVCKRSQPCVDEHRGLIYFVGFKDTPVETHVYCVCYRCSDSSRTVQRITNLGFDHSHSRDTRPIAMSSCGTLIAVTKSNLKIAGQPVVYKLKHEQGTPLPKSFILCELSANTSQQQSMDVDEDDITRLGAECQDPIPEIISYESVVTGFTHYACLWRPHNFQHNVKYPTILCVYAGPEIQLVKNCFMGGSNFTKYSSLGYLVLMIDGRGSANRGLDFERGIWGNMGTVEINDQVEGLQFVNAKYNCIDLSRVAIVGWSYGGYAALMGLAKKGDVFKIAVSGAPVVSWELYDTGYTERYLGMPNHENENRSNKRAAASSPSRVKTRSGSPSSTGSPPLSPRSRCKRRYDRSSVLPYVRSLPDEPNRLIIFHGLMDENVHFSHVALLIDALLAAGKPYQLQIFPRERHGMRNFECSVHFDATLLDFLQRNL